MRAAWPLESGIDANSTNCTVTTETPSTVVDESWSMPLMELVSGRGSPPSFSST